MMVRREGKVEPMDHRRWGRAASNTAAAGSRRYRGSYSSGAFLHMAVRNIKCQVMQEGRETRECMESRTPE